MVSYGSGSCLVRYQENRSKSLLASALKITELVVGSRIVDDLDLRKHGVVLELGLSDDWAVRGDENQLGLAVSEGLQGRLVAQRGLAGLHDQLQD